MLKTLAAHPVESTLKATRLAADRLVRDRTNERGLFLSGPDRSVAKSENVRLSLLCCLLLADPYAQSARTPYGDHSLHTALRLAFAATKSPGPDLRQCWSIRGQRNAARQALKFADAPLRFSRTGSMR